MNHNKLLPSGRLRCASRLAGLKSVRLQGGPYAGQKTTLDAQKSTLTFTVKGRTGRYRAGVWEPAL